MFASRILLGLLVLGFSFAPVVAVPVDPVEEPPKPIAFPDGVLDPARQTAFVTTPKGGIQAIRLEDGKVLWTANEALGQPWLVAGDRLIARGDRIYVLDLKKEGKVRPCEDLLYPKVVAPERCTVAFHLWSPRVTDSTLEAKWYAVASIDRSKGRPFNFEAWTGFNKGAPAGTVKVNMDTGRVDVATDPKPVDVTMGLMPGTVNSPQMPAGLPEKLTAVWQQYQKDQNGRITPLENRLVGVAMLLEKDGAEYRKKVVLNSWDLKTGGAADPIVLTEGKALDIANIALTEDRRHAVVQFGTSALAIYSLADGKRVATEVKGVLTPEEAFVQGKRLYHVLTKVQTGDRLLTAIDLDSGKQSWVHPLKPRNIMPLPPGAGK
jgi:hypothetical protein